MLAGELIINKDSTHKNNRTKSCIFINFEHISHLFLVFLCYFEQVNVSRDDENFFQVIWRHCGVQLFSKTKTWQESFFKSMFPFYAPWKHQKTRCFGYRKESVAWDGLIIFVTYSSLVYHNTLYIFHHIHRWHNTKVGHASLQDYDKNCGRTILQNFLL